MNYMKRATGENYQIPKVENLTKSDGKFLIQY